MDKNKQQQLDILCIILKIKKVFFISSFVCFIIGGMFFLNILMKLKNDADTNEVEKITREAKSSGNSIRSEVAFYYKDYLIPLILCFIGIGGIFSFIGNYPIENFFIKKINKGISK